MQGLVEETDPNSYNSNALNPGNFKTIKLIPDGAAKFTRAMGMTCELLIHYNIYNDLCIIYFVDVFFNSVS